MFIDKFNSRNGVLEISASNLNRMVDAITENVRSSRGEYGKCYVQNKTGGDAVMPFAIFGIGEDIVYDPNIKFKDFANTPTFQGVAPIEGTHDSKFIVALEPVRDNGVSEAVICGAVPAKINVTDELHEYAAIADGITEYFTSSVSGTNKILWKESGEGLKWGIVQIGSGSGLPYIYETTSAPIDGIIKAKRIDSNRNQVGEEEEFVVIPEESGV